MNNSIYFKVINENGGIKWEIRSGDFEYSFKFMDKKFFLYSINYNKNTIYMDYLCNNQFSVEIDGQTYNGLSEFNYEHHQIKERSGKEEILTISLLNEVKGIRVSLHYIVYGETGIIGRFQTIQNTSEETYLIDGMTSYTMKLPKGRFRLNTLSGSWGKEHNHQQEILTQGLKVLQNKTGRSSNGMSPWFALENLQTGITYISQIAWSGNWKTAFEVQPDHSLLVDVGINDWEFQHHLDPGLSIETPLAVFGMVLGDMDDASKSLLRYQRHHVIPETKEGYPLVQFNTWYNGEGYVPIDLMKSFANVAAEIGCEVFVLDAGWYNHQNWGNTLGDWKADSKWFPNGLEELVEYVHQLDLHFGLWIEVEIAGDESELYVQHPEWIQKRNGKNNVYEPHPFRLPLCLADDQVKKWALSEVCRLVEQYNLKWLKMDFNTDLGPGCDDKNHGHQKGDGLYQYYRAYYDLLDQITAKYPELIIENCASGGMRFDLGLLHRTHTNWISDEIKPGPSLHFIHGATRAFSPVVCNQWVVEVPDFGPKEFYDFNFRIPMMGHFGIGANVKNWTAQIKQYARENINLYKRIRHLIASGDVYHLTDQPDWTGFGSWGGNAWVAMQYVSEDLRESVAFIYHTNVADRRRRIRLKGLNEGKTYQLIFEDTQEELFVPGYRLMQEGLVFELKSHVDSEIVHLKEINELIQ